MGSSLLAVALGVALYAAPVAHLGPPAPASPKRIVTLAPSLTEVVLALGEGARLVGVTRYDDDPRVASLARVGGFTDPSAEAIAKLQPDLVIAQPSPGNRGPVEAVARLGAPILVVRLDTVADVLDALRAVGAALGKASAGEALARGLEAKRAQVRARAAGSPRVKSLLLLGVEPLVAAGPGSFAGELLTDAGGDNVVGESAAPYPTFSAERAAALRPAVVLVAPDVGGDLPLPPGLSGARVVRVSSFAVLRPGPRLGEALDELYGDLHPGKK